MQMAYIFWTLLVEGRPRATIAALFMFTCRGILGYSTQLPLPQVVGIQLVPINIQHNVAVQNN